MVTRFLNTLKPACSKVLFYKFSLLEVFSDKRSLSVRNLGLEEKPLVGPLQDASSTLRSVSMASLPHDDGKKTSRNADSSTAGQRKFYEVGIIHYAPERFAGVKERNAQFGGLSPPPIKKDLKTNVIITEQQNRPEYVVYSGISVITDLFPERKVGEQTG